MKLFVVVPAYNAGRHLARVFDRLLSGPPAELAGAVVVDDGSTDDTLSVARALASRHAGRLPIEVRARARNGGYGAAMKDGLSAARRSGAGRVACVHADGQYSPEVLPRLLSAMDERGLDLLQGSRIAGGQALSGGMPLYKYLGNAALNVLENLTFGLSLTDYHSGYLIYGARALERIPFPRLSDSFDFDLEVIASARGAGLSVGEAPIPTHYGDEISHLSPVRYGLRVLRVLWRYHRRHYESS